MTFIRKMSYEPSYLTRTEPRHDALAVTERAGFENRLCVGQSLWPDPPVWYSIHKDLFNCYKTLDIYKQLR